MPATEKISLKHHCLNVLEKQIHDMESTMDDIYVALEEETKSSAGDKYETNRAQLQIEQDRLDKQLEHLKHQYHALYNATHDPQSAIEDGCTVELEVDGKPLSVYISIALGAIEFNGKKWQVISEISPLAQWLKDKKTGDSFSANGKKYSVKSVI